MQISFPKLNFGFTLLVVLMFSVILCKAESSPISSNFVIDKNSTFIVNSETFNSIPAGGDTIFVSSDRTKALKFQNLDGDTNNPIVIINKGGQVKIDDPDNWGALTFENCKNIKISGKGHPGFKYGFLLSANQSGLAFTELSSNCETEFIKIDHQGFFGIYAKKDYGGYPPNPVPVFEHLSIHDCFIQNVTEGMYLGETKTPGMEFKHVSIYNNIVLNTGREAIQIANMVEDVEIYNNTLLNTGKNTETYQDNILQIGDNSVANVYNNILIGAPGFGIISLGMGNNTYSNNYIANAKGIFIDNRTVSIPNSPIEVSHNYFKSIVGYEVIKNMNEVNQVQITDNLWDCEIDFFKNASGNSSDYYINNNVETTIETILFTNPDNNDYSLNENYSSEFTGIGAPGGPEYFDFEEPAPVETSKQIVLNSEMLVDEVTGGSYYSPDYLIDEQDKNYENNLHPISKSWKPYWNMNNAPYHVYIDLKHLHRVTQIAFHDMHDKQNLEISIGEPGNWQTLFTESCDKYKTWKVHQTNITTRYIRLSMKESVNASVNEVNIYGYALQAQIELNTNMISDEVDGGSYNSPNFLVDEQTMNPESEMHPVSLSWKPHWNMEKAPYHATIDLGKSFDITTLYLHDMHNVANFNVEYGEPGNWQTLVTESCNSYKTWKKHNVKITSRFIRVSIYESIAAAVNELLLFGKPANVQNELKSAVLKSELITKNKENKLKSNRFILFPNPVENSIMLNIPGHLKENFKLEIFDTSGKLYFSKEYFSTENNLKIIDITQANISPGIHILHYSDKRGVNENIKFYKK